MKNLWMMNNYPLMAEAGDAGGEGGGGTSGSEGDASGGEGNEGSASGGEGGTSGSEGSAPGGEGGAPNKSALGKLVGDGGEGGKETPPVDFEKLSGADYANNEAFDADTKEFIEQGFGEVFRAAKVSPDQAAAIVKAYLGRMDAERQANNERLTAEADKALEGWSDADKGLVAAAYEHFAPKGSVFREALSTTNLGNDPHMLALLKAAGRAVERDNGAGAGAVGSGAVVPLAKQLGIEL